MKFEAEYMDAYEGTADEQLLKNLQDHCALLALPHLMRSNPNATEFFFDLGDRTLSYEFDCHCEGR